MVDASIWKHRQHIEAITMLDMEARAPLENVSDRHPRPLARRFIPLLIAFSIWRRCAPVQIAICSMLAPSRNAANHWVRMARR
jgi:hypothetical protein